mmetsp:Transcript_10770/g.26198  ORF Transcript_10770/g.26198 Transcript_10770/m.26198 type:complete len:454 (-) Transcript_10770:1143-2504(-)
MRRYKHSVVVNGDAPWFAGHCKLATESTVPAKRHDLVVRETRDVDCPFLVINGNATRTLKVAPPKPHHNLVRTVGTAPQYNHLVGALVSGIDVPVGAHSNAMDIRRNTSTKGPSVPRHHSRLLKRELILGLHPQHAQDLLSGFTQPLHAFVELQPVLRALLHPPIRPDPVTQLADTAGQTLQHHRRAHLDKRPHNILCKPICPPAHAASGRAPIQVALQLHPRRQLAVVLVGASLRTLSDLLLRSIQQCLQLGQNRLHQGREAPHLKHRVGNALAPVAATAFGLGGPLLQRRPDALKPVLPPQIHRLPPLRLRLRLLLLPLGANGCEWQILQRCGHLQQFCLERPQHLFGARLHQLSQRLLKPLGSILGGEPPRLCHPVRNHGRREGRHPHHSVLQLSDLPRLREHPHSLWPPVLAQELHKHALHPLHQGTAPCSVLHVRHFLVKKASSFRAC